LPIGKRLARLGVHVGDVLQFSGRVRLYHHRRETRAGSWEYVNEDFGFRYPTHMQIAARAGQPAPLELHIGRHKSANKTLALIANFTRNDGEPPSVSKLFYADYLKPFKIVHALDVLAREGAIRFLPDGHVYIVTEDA
jgi:hypothetical protein